MARNTNKKSTSKFIKIAFSIPIVLIIITVVWIFVGNPTMDYFDHKKYIKLDKDMQTVFNTIRSQANSGDDWKYKAVCEANKTGEWSTGDYNCVTSISLQKNVSSIDEVNALHSKYYPQINENNLLTQSSELDTNPKTVFGKYFVVGSHEKKYVHDNSGIECTYLAKLYQSIENSDFTSEMYGSDITENSGRIILSLRCSNTAHKAWYEISKTASQLVP